MHTWQLKLRPCLFEGFPFTQFHPIMNVYHLYKCSHNAFNDYNDYFSLSRLICLLWFTCESPDCNKEVQLPVKVWKLSSLSAWLNQQLTMTRPQKSQCFCGLSPPPHHSTSSAVRRRHPNAVISLCLTRADAETNVHRWRHTTEQEAVTHEEDVYRETEMRQVVEQPQFPWSFSG